MIKRECAKNPKLKNESWEKFMPKYVSKNVKKQKKVIKEKKEYTPFPPPQQPSKVDLQLGKWRLPLWTIIYGPFKKYRFQFINNNYFLKIPEFWKNI